MSKGHWSAGFAHDNARDAERFLLAHPRHAAKKFQSCLHFAKEAWLRQSGITPDVGNGWWSLDEQFSRVASDADFGRQLAWVEDEFNAWLDSGAQTLKDWLKVSHAVTQLVALLDAYLPLIEGRRVIRNVRLGYRPSFETAHDDPPYQTISLIPVFPHVRTDIQEKTTIVWDLPQLCESIREPGGYDVLNCTCGLPDDADLNGMAFVSHPNDATVVWEIDIPDHRPALHERWHSRAGYLRLVFRRADYETDIRAMLQAVLTAGTAGLPVEEYDPNRRGNAYDRLRALAVNNDWSRQPVLPSGTRLEFQPGQDSHVFLDSKPLREYVPRLITRWSVAQAYNRWTRMLWGKGHFKIDAPVACDSAGREFVARLQASYAEGATAPPDVTITYRSDLTPAI